MRDPEGSEQWERHRAEKKEWDAKERVDDLEEVPETNADTVPSEESRWNAYAAVLIKRCP